MDKFEEEIPQQQEESTELVRTEEEFQQAIKNYINDQLGGLTHFNVNSDETAYQKLGLFLKGYMLCKASDCPYYEACPIMRSIKSKPKREALRNTDCRWEMMNAARLVIGLIKKLEIEDDNMVDLGYVTQIAVNQMYLDRIDLDISINGMWQTNPGVLDQRNGVLYHRKEINELIKYRGTFEKSKDEAVSKLNASRKDKVKNTAKTGTLEELKSLIDNISKEPTGAVIDNIIDAEVS